jgi:hypothetical protein
MARLSPDLKPIYDLELALGNKVAWTAEPAGTEAPYAVGFEQPLHFDEVAARLAVPPTVTRWSVDDPHYGDPEAGFKCRRTGHVLAGPLPR